MMCRKMCLVLVLILFGGGCGRRSAPPQAQALKTNETSTASAPARTPQVSEKAVAPMPAVVTDFVPTGQGTVAGAVWGLKPVPAEGGHWSLRDMDFLPDQRVADEYLAAFRKGEPDAKFVPL